MNLTVDDLQQLCDAAIDAAVTTGQYLSTTRPINIEHKDSGGSLATQVVTEVDRESQRRILESLAPSLTRFDLGLLTEESPDDGSRLSKDYFWCIDPIDGTLCFIEGVPGYAISIALISREGVPVIGVVYDPVRQILYHAIRDAGAFCRSRPWRPDLNRSDQPLTIFTDRSELAGPLFQTTARSIDGRLGTCGGGVLNAIWCLENSPACYFKFAKPGNGGGCFWDFAATTCIYQELGAWATDVQGRPLNLNRAETIYMNHCGILFATNSAVAERFLERTAQ